MVKLADPTREVPPHMVIDEIVRTIVERLQPRRLILFGSRARGDAGPDSDYDVAVEMESAIPAPREFAREIERFFPGAKGWYLNVFPRAAGEIERAANDPGTVDWDIAREGKVLYAKDGVSPVLAPPLRGREEPREAPASVRRWAAKAQRDLEHARRSAEMGDSWDYVCYNAHQSAEKFLKALLVRSFKRPKRIHTLDVLLRDAIAAGAPVAGLLDDCIRLTPFAIDARYGDPDEFDEATGRAALAAAERIAAAVTHLLG